MNVSSVCARVLPLLDCHAICPWTRGVVWTIFPLLFPPSGPFWSCPSFMKSVSLCPPFVLASIRTCCFTPSLVSCNHLPLCNQFPLHSGPAKLLSRGTSAVTPLIISSVSKTVRVISWSIRVTLRAFCPLHFMPFQLHPSPPTPGPLFFAVATDSPRYSRPW
jgi:hypothetical protein